MKNIVRSLALLLVATGAFASSNIKASSQPHLGKASAFPIPTCDPNVSDCGICGVPGAACLVDGN